MESSDYYYLVPGLLSGAPSYRVLSGALAPGALSGNPARPMIGTINYSPVHGLMGVSPDDDSTGKQFSQPDFGEGDPGYNVTRKPTVGADHGSASDRLNLAARKRVNVQQCELQLERDLFQCNMVGLAGCYAQAHERYGNCLAGRPIPPFNY